MLFWYSLLRYFMEFLFFFAMEGGKVWKEMVKIEIIHHNI